MSCRLREILGMDETDFRVPRRLAAGEVIFADVLLLPNGMSKVGAIE